jgi:hypothetical protein
MPDTLAEDQTLADRLVNYGDAVVALAFIISSGLGLAAADPDIRASFTDVRAGMIIGNIILGVVFSLLLLVLRRWEQDLRVDSLTSDKFRQYSLRLHLARHAVVWLTVIQTVVVMLVIDL